MDLSLVFAEEVSREVTVGKFGTLNVTYSPSAYTPEAEQMIRRAQQDKEGSRTGWLTEFVPNFIRAWDLKVSSEAHAQRFGVAVGEVVPLTPEAVGKLPSEFLVDLINAAAEGAAPNEASSSPRETTSSTEGDGEQ